MNDVRARARPLQSPSVSLRQSSPARPADLAPTPPAHQPKLLDRLREAFRSRHYSRRTEQAYCHWVNRFIFFHHVRHPIDVAEPEINAFLTHLAVKEDGQCLDPKSGAQRRALLYRYVLDREIGGLGDVIRARKPRHLPVVMTREEVKAVLSHLQGNKWLLASLMYGAGLRLMECL